MSRRALAPLLFLAAGVACGPEPVAPVLEHPIPPIGITQVSPDGEILAVGDSLQMSARVIAPRDFEIVRIEWDVSDTSLASVSASGVVLARKRGSFGVRATMFNAAGSAGQGVASVHIE